MSGRTALRYSVALTLLLACNTAEFIDTPGGFGSDGDCTGSAACDAGTGPTDAARRTDAGRASPSSQGVTIQVEPGDKGEAVVSAIRGATTSVHMTMYLLTTGGMGAEVINALGDLQQAGKDVKVILNKSFPPNGGDNNPSFDELTARGVPVHWAPSTFTFTHAKTILIDAHEAIIMTMNLTATSVTTNREYIAFDTDPDDVADLEKVFSADFADQPISLATKLVVSPKGANTVWPRDQIKALIDSAQSSLDVEMQSLSDKTIVDAIILAHESNVDVHVIVDGDTSTSSSELAVIARLKQSGVPLRSLKTPDLHAKVMVVDERRVWVGSQNMTSTALFDNREVGVITDSPSEASKVRAVIAADFDKGVEL